MRRSSSYFRLMQGLLRRLGVPLALYTDRRPVFKHKSEYQPADTPIQFGLAMEELGVQVIFALSPQAKGRVERADGTFQDRLITELRLSGATTFEQARAVLKQFLPRFNRRFGVPAQCPELVSRARIPALAGGPALGTSPVLQAPQESSQGLHREAPEAHPAAAPRSKAPQLCRGGCGGTGRTGRPAVSAA